MITRFLLWLSARLPVRVISDKGVPFLERYFVCRLFGCCIYIHRFVASDPDRGLHDHPWPWALSLVLKGWYYECTRRGTRKVLWANWLHGDSFHRVVLPFEPFALRDAGGGLLKIVRTSKRQECWTLFVHGPKCKPWGFMRPAWVRGDQPEQMHAHIYVEHRDRDDSHDSAAWAAQAPKGRELRS